MQRHCVTVPLAMTQLYRKAKYVIHHSLMHQVLMLHNIIPPIFSSRYTDELTCVFINLQVNVCGTVYLHHNLSSLCTRPIAWDNGGAIDAESALRKHDTRSRRKPPNSRDANWESDRGLKSVKGNEKYGIDLALLLRLLTCIPLNKIVVVTGTGFQVVEALSYPAHCIKMQFRVLESYTQFRTTSE